MDVKYTGSNIKYIESSYIHKIGTVIQFEQPSHGLVFLADTVATAATPRPA